MKMLKFFLFGFALCLMSAVLHAELIAPEGLPQPSDAYTVFNYKKSKIDVEVGKPITKTFQNYVKLNFHGDPNQSYVLSYAGYNDADTVLGTVTIPKNWNGKSALPLSMSCYSHDLAQKTRDVPLTLISSVPDLGITQHNTLTARIINEPSLAPQIFFNQTEGYIAEPPNGLKLTFYLTVRLSRLIDAKVKVRLSHNDYPGVACDTLITFDPLQRIREVQYTVTGNSGFINKNIQFRLEKITGTGNPNYDILPGGGVIDVEVHDNTEVTAQFSSTPNNQTIRIGEVTEAVVKTGGFALPQDTDVNVTLAFSGKAKYPDDISVNVPNIVVPEKPVKNKLTFRIKGTDAATIKLQPTPDYQNAGKTKDFKVTLESVVASSKTQSKGELTSTKSFKINIAEGIAKTAVAAAFYTDTQCVVRVPEGPLDSPVFAYGETGSVSGLTPESFLYTYENLRADSLYANGFIDQFEYIILAEGHQEKGLTRVYAGQPVTKGSDITVALREGSYLKAPSIYVQYYDPVKDPFEAKKMKKISTKIVVKPAKNGSDTALMFSLSKTPLLVDKSLLKTTQKAGIYFADSQTEIQKPFAGMALSTKWKQGVEGDQNYVEPISDFPFGAVIAVQPEMSVDSAIWRVGNTVPSDSVIAAEAEILARGYYFSPLPKASLEYKDLNNKIKRMNLKVIKTPKNADPADYTYMDPVTGISQARIILPKQNSIDKIMESGNPVYLIIDSGAGYAAHPIYAK